MVMNDKDINTNLIKKTIQLIVFAFVAKGFGFIREMILAYYYGASTISDVYIAVQNIPAIIFSLFGVAVTTGFIPIYSELNIKRGKKIADKFTNNVFNIFIIVSILMTLLGIIFSKQLVSIFVGGFKEETLELCNNFAKIIMPISVAIILVYVYNAYLQIQGEFNQNSLMNLPYNICQIVFIYLAYHINNIYLLAVGILLASFSQLAYLHFLMKKHTNFKYEKYVNFRDPNILQILILVGPVFISTGVNQLNSIIDRALASGLLEGSVSALSYSSEVSNIVTQVIILSLTTILYPKMTKLFISNDNLKKREFTERYVNIVSVIVFPLSILVFMFSKECVEILFGRGAFNEETVVFVSKALKVYAIGIVGASFRDVLNRVFYAMKDTVTPMVNGVITVLCNIILNFSLVGTYGYLGLAFSTSISATMCTLLMFIQLRRKMNDLNVVFILREFIKVLFAIIVMLGTLYILREFIIINSDIVRCVVLGGIASMIYIIILLATKETLIIEIFNKIKIKITK